MSKNVSAARHMDEGDLAIVQHSSHTQSDRQTKDDDDDATGTNLNAKFQECIKYPAPALVVS